MSTWVKYSYYINYEVECDAAHNLAAALANYDKDDYRTLKFEDIKVRQS